MATDCFLLLVVKYLENVYIHRSVQYVIQMCVVYNTQLAVHKYGKWEVPNFGCSVFSLRNAYH